MEEIRLQKYMASCGVASRRACEALILDGKVQVNGKTVTELGTKVTEKDRVYVNGHRIRLENEKVYIMLNKPRGYVTTSKDQFDRKCVMDLMTGVKQRVYPVGRLDYDTSGLLILTNDGEFTKKVTHPSHQVVKTYIARTSYSPDKQDLETLAAGVTLPDGTKFAPADVTVLEPCLVIIKVTEGKYHEVKRIMEYVNCPVKWLKRIAVGGLELGKLPEGKWRYLMRDELKLILGEED